MRDPKSMGYSASVLPFFINRLGRGHGTKFIDQGLLKNGGVNDDFSLIVAICPMANNSIGLEDSLFKSPIIFLNRDKWVGCDFFNLKWATIIKSLADACFGQ